MTVRFFYPVPSYSLYIIRCNPKPLLVLLVCLCKIFQRTLSLVAKRCCISQKRVQKYKQFSIPPNISRKKFIFTLLFNTYKQLTGVLRLFSPILAKRQGTPFNAEKNLNYVKIKQKPRKMKLKQHTRVRTGTLYYYLKDMLKNWVSIERTNGNQNVQSRVISKN